MRVFAPWHQEFLLHAKIAIVKTGSAEGVFSEVPISEAVDQGKAIGSQRPQELTADERTGESAEVSCDRVERENTARVEVRAVTAAAVAVRVNARQHGKGLARLPCDDLIQVASVVKFTLIRYSIHIKPPGFKRLIERKLGENHLPVRQVGGTLPLFKF